MTPTPRTKHLAAPQRHAPPPTATPADVSPLEREARAAAQKAYDEVKGGGRAGFSSGHSRQASAVVSAHASARSKVLDDAIKAGKITTARRGHYAAQYDRDPAGTSRLLASLAPVPCVAAANVAGATEKPTRLSAPSPAAVDGTGFPSTDPLPSDVSLLHGEKWADHARQLRERQDLEQHAATTAGESIQHPKDRLAHAARRREQKRLAG